MPLGYCSKQMQTISPHTWWTYLYLLTSPIYLVFSSQYLLSSNVTQGENSSSMIHYAQYCLHNLSLVSLHGKTLSHLLKDQFSHLQMPCSMKDSSDPLVTFLYNMESLVVEHSCWLFIVRVCHCPSSVSTVWLSCYQWWCGPVLVRSNLTVVLEWCSVLMDCGSHCWFCGWVVCWHWGWQYHWCGQWWLWWKNVMYKLKGEIACLWWSQLSITNLTSV